MKFYEIVRGIIKPKEHHIIFPFHYNGDRTDYLFWLINLTDEELNGIETYYYETINFQERFPKNDFEVPLWNFLKLKHTFNITGNYSDEPLGITSFELSEYDIMYLKLLQ